MDGEFRHVGNARHAEVRKIALLHHTIFQGDRATWQAHRQAHQRRALDLGLDTAWVDRQVAVHTGCHVVQHRTAVLYRGFDDVGHHRAERLVDRHAPGMTRW
ncbi:hypothetical protein D3C76_1258920 [compost metagenome]